MICPYGNDDKILIINYLYMKKLFWALLSVLLVTTLSCGKQPEPTIDPSGDSTQKTDSGDPYASDDPSSISDPSGDDGPVDDGPMEAVYVEMGL